MNRILYFCERERDLAPMTVIMVDGRMHARPRRPDDRPSSDGHMPTFQDRWTHVKSGGLYTRLDPVVDDEDGTSSYTYRSDQGRTWMRPVAEWFETSGERPRFEPIGPAHD